MNWKPHNGFGHCTLSNSGASPLDFRYAIKSINKDKPRGDNHRDKDRLEQIQLIIETTTQEMPEAETHWTTRGFAEMLGTSHSFVHRVWQAVGLKPQLQKSCKVSNDKQTEEKLCDVVGLYLNPPENTIVFCVDEKTSIQVGAGHIQECN